MSLRRVLVLFGVLCLFAAAVVGSSLIVTPAARAAANWTTERIYSDPSNQILRVQTQGDYVVWSTYSNADSRHVDLLVHKISTKQTKRIAGRDLAYHVDSDPLLDGTHVVWEEDTSDGGSDIILYDIASGTTVRLNAAAPGCDEFQEDVQGDWVVWHGLIEPGPGDWVYDPVVFAYRISTSGPTQTIRWRDQEAQSYTDDYRSMDEYPQVSNGKMGWSFVRPDGGAYLGVMNLVTRVVEWQWKSSAGHQAGIGSMWGDYMLIGVTSPDPANQPYGFLWGLSLRSPGQAEPDILVPDGKTYISRFDVSGGLAAWCAGDAYWKKPGGQVVKVAGTSGVMDLSNDGSHLAWSRLGAIWWHDTSTGGSESIPGAAGAAPVVSGSQVAWTGDYKSGNGNRSVYLATRSGGGFPDVPSGHPYFTAISGMAARGVIGGYTSGNFGPADLVTRQQFAKMIVLTLGLGPTVTEDQFPSAAVPFLDLGPDDTSKLYPHEYVAVCALNNITKGIDATHFGPTFNIKRAQMSTMVVRAADNLATGSLAPAPDGWSGALSYADVTHGANIKKAEYNGLLAGIIGSGGTLASWGTSGNATRGEVAQILWNLLAKMH